MKLTLLPLHFRLHRVGPFQFRLAPSTALMNEGIMTIVVGGTSALADANWPPDPSGSLSSSLNTHLCSQSHPLDCHTVAAMQAGMEESLGFPVTGLTYPWKMVFKSQMCIACSAINASRRRFRRQFPHTCLFLSTRV